MGWSVRCRVVLVVGLVCGLCWTVLLPGHVLRAVTQQRTPAVVSDPWTHPEVSAREPSTQAPEQRDVTTAAELTWEARQRARRSRVHSVCSTRRQQERGSLTAIKNSGSSPDWSGQFLVADEFRYLYCNIAKVASTSWKTALHAVSTARNKTAITLPGSAHYRRVLASAGIRGLETYTVQEIKSILANYTSFMFVRHPIERLVSAFADKIEKADKSSLFYQYYGRPIIEHYRRNATRGAGGGQWEDGIRFEEFVRFILDEAAPLNPHWDHQHRVCMPCFVHYDVIGKVSTLHEDAEHVMTAVLGGGDVARAALDAFPRHNAHHYHNTVLSYLDRLSCSQLAAIHRFYQTDLHMFGYDVISSSKCPAAETGTRAGM